MGCTARLSGGAPAAPLLSYAHSQLSRPLSNQGINLGHKGVAEDPTVYNLAR